MILVLYRLPVNKLWIMTSWGTQLGRVIVSLAMEAALEGSANYAGGLGVLEADKLYAAGRLGLPYILIAPLYPGGYVDYVLSSDGKLVEAEHRHSQAFISSLSRLGSIETRGRIGRLVAAAELYEYRYGSARAILYAVREPKRVTRLFEYLYRHQGDECMYYIAASALASQIALKVAPPGSVVDVQESHLAFSLYMIPEGYVKRFITHTPGPWGHPRLCRDEAEDLLGISLPSVGTMTEAAMEASSAIYTVSRKHSEIMRRLFPRYAERIGYITNAVDPERWGYVGSNIEGAEALFSERMRARSELESLIAGSSGKRPGGRLIVAWARRVTRYKRPYFVEWLAGEKDLRDRIFIVAGGKPHIADHWGRVYAERLAKLSRELGNIFYTPSYSVELARIILSGSDLLLFTPFPGWEASGTSQIKAGINGVPTLSSRDGASLEIIEHGVSGWLFGSEPGEFIDIYSDPRVGGVDENDYRDMLRTLVKVIEIYENDRERYMEISYEAYRRSREMGDIRRLLRQYYPEFLK